MPKDYPRANRVATRIREEISPLVAGEMSNPRVGLASVTDVEVSSELSQVKIYVSAIGTTGSDRTAADSAAEALNEKVGLFRHRLSQRLNMRYTPNIRFVADHSQADADRITKLIDSVAPAAKRDDDEDNSGDKEPTGGA